ncbi:hypothetical protein P43SY_011436 [Pythium insidiosum]|uniref:Uncharacterized protein n=1 Tax=Pythium insidiosum TaxID=114742 RepID=A0AAD5Q1N7_PYTIN|nr:hypothetical protein P43SY_011436 [Pythium insidiosum]
MKVETPVVPIFVLNEFATTKDDDSDSHRVGTTPAERYKRALQSTNRIAAELAECSDDKEFEEFEAYLLAEWRNIRQRKRRRVNVQSPPDVSPPDVSNDEAVAEMSQPHSLYDGDVGCLGSIADFDPAEESRRPKFERKKNPVLNADAFYLLPKKLLKASIKALPLQNTMSDAIWIASQSQSSVDDHTDDEQEVVTIVNVEMAGESTASPQQQGDESGIDPSLEQGSALQQTKKRDRDSSDGPVNPDYGFGGPVNPEDGFGDPTDSIAAQPSPAAKRNEVSGEKLI